MVPGCYHVVSLDKKLYSTLSPFTQVQKWNKWVPVKQSLHAIETRLSSGPCAPSVAHVCGPSVAQVLYQPTFPKSNACDFWIHITRISEKFPMTSEHCFRTLSKTPEDVLMIYEGSWRWHFRVLFRTQTQHLEQFTGLFWWKYWIEFFTLVVNEQVVRNCESSVWNCPQCVW